MQSCNDVRRCSPGTSIDHNMCIHCTHCASSTEVRRFFARYLHWTTGCGFHKPKTRQPCHNRASHCQLQKQTKHQQTETMCDLLAKPIDWRYIGLTGRALVSSHHRQVASFENEQLCDVNHSAQALSHRRRPDRLQHTV